MSPKSRGRPPGRGRPKGKPRPPRELTLAERAVRDTWEIAEFCDDALVMESWASTVLGAAWADAPFGDDEAEHRLFVDVAKLAARRPSPAGTAAMAALRLVADSRGRAVLDAALDGQQQGPPLPPWATAPTWTPVAAYRSLDVWGSERVLFVEFDGPLPHCLLAVVSEVPGRWVTELELVPPGTAQEFDNRDPGEALGLQRVEPRPAEEVLADLADAMQCTDQLRPRDDDPDYAGLRALAWSRCRPYLSSRPAPRPETEPTDDAELDELLDAFVGSGVLPDDAITRALADLFVEHGEECLPVPPLGWNPSSVAYFLTDWLPSEVQLSAGERGALLGTLRHWVTFALTRQGIAQEWIDPVIAAVDANAAEFEEAFDEGEKSWLLVQQIAAELAAQGVDMSDEAAVTQAARRLLDRWTEPDS